FQYSQLSTSFEYDRAVQLSQKPRVFLYKGFLTDEECDHLINVAKHNLTRSKVGHSSGHFSLGRTSSTAGLDDDDKVVARLKDRIEAWTLLPKENGETMQVQRYEKGQHYMWHADFMDNQRPIAGGNRVVTLIMYLSTVTKGGETFFPNAKARLKPKKGDALLFFNLNLDESPDETSRHGSCPVVEGEKWVATHWVHVRAHRYSASMYKEGECRDRRASCKARAAAGACVQNDPFVVKFCKHSCRFCVFGAPS
ncbi:putative prolyl 4-hydroxylase 7, partial [Nymphaea thermarum]